MKAMVFRKYGGPEVIQLEERQIPELAPGRVRVRIHTTAINDWDWGYVRGEPYIYRLLFGLRRPKITILGAEVAGVVDAVGEGVSTFAPDDHVYGDLSEAGFGGFAEYVSVPEKALRKMPQGMSFEQAVAIPHAGGLAAQGLLGYGQLSRGERVLINGAGGGVGTLALQLAKALDAEVTGVDSGLKLDMMRELGFDHVLDYTQTDYTNTGDQYDVILDAKSTKSAWAITRALSPGGRYVSVGGHVPNLLSIVSWGALLGKARGKSIRLLPLVPNEQLDAVEALFQAGTLRTVIDGPFTLDQVPEALAHFGAARHLGKVVIRVA